jgi:anti-sigma regulatory factor (Ser/Thr protein kinase)
VTHVTNQPFASAPPPAGPGVVLHWRAHYDNVPHSIAAARFLARDFLTELTDAKAVELSGTTAGDVLLVVSELVTNAALHHGGPRMLDLVYTADGIDVVVWDTGSELPEHFPHDPNRIGGHGVEIVIRLCSLFETQRVPGGKRVLARVPVP